MGALQKAMAKISDSQRLVPRVFNAPYGGASYFGQAYKWEEVLHLKYWFGIGARAWIAEIAGGEGPKLGSLCPKEEGEAKVLQKSKSLGINHEKALHAHRVLQAKLRKRGYNAFNKALGGPQEHEEFEAWDDQHPIVRLFHVPNALDTAYDLWAYTTLFYLLTGEAHWWVFRNNFGVPVELWVIPTHWMRLVTGKDGLPVAWAIQSPWGTLQYAQYDDVLSFRDHSPLNRYEGWGTTLMIAEWMDAYEANVRARLAQYNNGAIPAFHVSLSDEYVDPDEAMLNRYYSKWFARFQGADNTGKPLITGPGVEVKQLGISPVDMQYIETENQFRDMILAAMRVPKGVIGLEPSSDTSAYAPQRQFLRFTINPTLGMFGQRGTHGLIRRTPQLSNGVMFWSDRVLDDPEQVQRDMSFRFSSGAASPNDIKTAYGEEPWPYGGDDPLLNGQVVPWNTGKQQQEDVELEQSFDRAMRGQISMEPDPVVIDKDEDVSPPSAKLRWHRTYDGHLEAAGDSGRWRIERVKGRNGLVTYKLRNGGTEIDNAGACGLLKELAERAETKAMGEASGASGGYLVPPEQPKIEYKRPEVDRQKHNDEVTDILRRKGLLLGRSMVLGNGT